MTSNNSNIDNIKMQVVLFVGGKDIMLYSKKSAKHLGSILDHAKINFIHEERHSLVNQSDKIRQFLNFLT